MGKCSKPVDACILARWSLVMGQSHLSFGDVSFFEGILRIPGGLVCLFSGYRLKSLKDSTPSITFKNTIDPLGITVCVPKGSLHLGLTLIFSGIIMTLIYLHAL